MAVHGVVDTLLTRLAATVPAVAYPQQQNRQLYHQQQVQLQPPPHALSLQQQHQLQRETMQAGHQKTMPQHQVKQVLSLLSGEQDATGQPAATPDAPSATTSLVQHQRASPGSRQPPQASRLQQMQNRSQLQQPQTPMPGWLVKNRWPGDFMAPTNRAPTGHQHSIQGCDSSLVQVATRLA